MKTIKTIIVLLAAALLAWALPWCYAFVCSEPQESPLTLYSCVTHDFATFSFEGHDDAAGYDPAGNPYTERQFDSIMPTVWPKRAVCPNASTASPSTPARSNSAISSSVRRPRN